RQPPPGGEAVEPEPVGRLGQQRLASRGVEGWLEVLDQIEARSAGRGCQDRIRGFPRAGEDGMGILYPVRRITDVGLQRRPPGADRRLWWIERPAVTIVQIDDATMALLLQGGRESKQRRESPRPFPRWYAVPGDRQRLAGSERNRRRKPPTRGRDLGRTDEV